MRANYIIKDGDLILRGVQSGTFIFQATQVDYEFLESICIGILNIEEDPEVRASVENILNIITPRFRGKLN